MVITMTDEKLMALQSITLAMEDVRKKFEYSSNPETVEVYCKCIEKLASVYIYIHNTED